MDFVSIFHSSLKITYSVLAGAVQWIECGPANQKVTSLSTDQGTCLGYGPDPHLGMCERQPIGVSLSLSPSCPLSLKISLKKKKKKENHKFLNHFCNFLELNSFSPMAGWWWGEGRSCKVAQIKVKKKKEANIQNKHGL